MSGMMKTEESKNEVTFLAQAVGLAQERFDLIGYSRIAVANKQPADGSNNPFVEG